jgi:hypothetical protein
MLDDNDNVDQRKENPKENRAFNARAPRSLFS